MRNEVKGCSYFKLDPYVEEQGLSLSRLQQASRVLIWCWEGRVTVVLKAPWHSPVSRCLWPGPRTGRHSGLQKEQPVGHTKALYWGQDSFLEWCPRGWPLQRVWSRGIPLAIFLGSIPLFLNSVGLHAFHQEPITQCSVKFLSLW